MKKHYHLVLGSIVFKEADSEVINAIQLNAILPTETQNIDAAQLGKAQQNLQFVFHKKMEDPTIQVVDVILSSFSYLGYMTKEEFYGEQTQVQPIKKSPLNLVPSNDVLPKE